MSIPSTDANRSVLKFLLQTCVDGQQGYQLASASIKDLELKTKLSSYVAQRARFCQELKVFLAAIAELPEEEPTFTGAVHNSWLNLKAIAKDGEPHAILVECVRGERAAVERYTDALAGGEMPQHARKVVQRQAVEIKAAHDRMELLSDRSK
jgi:uncharacterized protein (TIGR02284 family)